MLMSKERFILFGIGIAGFLGCLDLTIVNTALPAIQISLGASITELQWVMTILLLALTAFMVIAGKLGDLYGRRLCLYIGLILFAVSSLGAGFSTNMPLLIFNRFFQGIAIAFLYTAPVALVSSNFPVNKHGWAMGMIIAANGLGLALGPALGGFIVSFFGWRWIFFINPIFVILSITLCWSTLNESKMELQNKKIDWWGGLLLAVAIPSLILGIVQGSEWGWSSYRIISLFLFALFGFLLFIFIELRIQSPIIEFHLFKHRVFFIGLLANFSLAFFYAVDFFLIPLYLHFIRHQEGYEIGLMLLPATIMVTLLSSTTGYMVDKQGPKYLLLIGLGLCALSAFSQSFFSATTPVYIALISYLMFGIAWACLLSPSIVAAMSAVSKDHSGVAMGTIGTLHNLGGTIGLALGTLIYELGMKSVYLSQLPHANEWMKEAGNNINQFLQMITTHTSLSLSMATQLFDSAFLQGYRWAMWVLILVSLIGFAGVLFGLKRKGH